MATTLEILAERTWKRTAHGWRLKCRQGEETFTDVNLLDLLILTPSKHKVAKIPKNLEKHAGADWLWYVGKPGAWRGFVVQAKKVDPAGGYKAIYHSQNFVPSWMSATPPVRQVDVMESFALRFGLLPIYVYYNHHSTPNTSHWQCCQQIDVAQLGCSMSPSSTAKLPKLTGRNGFDLVHSDVKTLPWRCINSCPNKNHISAQVYHSIKTTSSLPFEDFDIESLTDEDLIRQMDLQLGDVNFLPKYIVVSEEEQEFLEISQ